ncbi:glycogen synthase GlgA [Arsenicitalea aurantiaca]|uniref:Glycogen synthase n=1 Tax=Arsenicitalea aurantiaca TaxID=1783274 RepID=A0A433XLX3_9HYPH|nr:glycogen synthase GlgA [Arsenicitalea aurantiaca]RUT35071.1 glycogen synthase GlgA [Arsenicitalea aurantiaca]
MTEILSVASEVYPLVKTGGLADVVGALPGALSPLGLSVRTLVPGYRPVMGALGRTREVARLEDLFGGPARILAGHAGGLDLIVIDAPHLYDRPGNPYVAPEGGDWPDNWQRFAALSRVGALLGEGLVDGYQPDILHAHDWQAGLAPAFVKYGANPRLRTVMTVHNLAFQGHFGADIFGALGLPGEAWAESIEYFGGVGFLKAGLATAHAVTTVSPTYAAEIRTPAFGMSLDGLLQARARDLHGILNGIDTDEWDPATDPALVRSYGPATLHRRRTNKRALEERFGLANDEGPLLGVVSRLTWQKGIDLLLAALDGVVAQGGRLGVLGSGDPELEEGLRAAAVRHPGRVGIVTGYDETLSRLVQGGADMMVVPSRFEPCGLTQLYGLRYGCVPVVSRVGGLADTIIDANEAALDAGVATGIQFAHSDAGALSEGLRRAMALHAEPAVWTKIQRRGMKSDVSWARSAQKYADLYKSLLGQDQ